MTSNSMLGIVQYSILEPTLFQQINGQEWVLMDGRSIDGSELFKLTGITILPDARGVFIRSMNENRDPGSGDADGNRFSGSYQKDIFEHHDHDVSYLNGQFFFAASGMGIQADEGQQAGRGHLGMRIAERGGNETRPRNISLYLYIKIN